MVSVGEQLITCLDKQVVSVFMIKRQIVQVMCRRACIHVVYCVKGIVGGCYGGGPSMHAKQAIYPSPYIDTLCPPTLLSSSLSVLHKFNLVMK